MHLLRRHARTLSTRETNEPVWRILAGMHRGGRPVELRAARVVVPDYERWRPFVFSKGLATAVDEMEGETGPLWLTLYLLAFRIRTPEDAYPAGLDLAYAQLPFAPKHFHGPLLIMALAGLSRFNLLLPIRRVVESFLTADLSPHSELYFNLFIQAMTITPTQSTETAQAIVLLLRRMEARKLQLFKETYDLLLNDQLLTIHLAHFLRFHMTRHATVPTTAQLEAYLRIFAKQGSVKEATQVHSTIHDRVTDPANTHHEDALLLSTRRGHLERPLDRANKLLLGVRADRTAATEFLQKLLQPKFRIKPKPYFNLRDLNLNKANLTIIPLTEPIPDIYAFTTSLSSHAADRSTPGRDLVGLFENARIVRKLSPTTVTYTRVTLNDWLVSLNRISRPDVVFAAWDALIPVYNIVPDARTLSIILAATRRACRLDETSLKAIVARMKYEIRGTFGTNSPSPEEEIVSMDAASQKLDSLLGPSKSVEPRPYGPGLWHGRLPANHTRLLFLQAMFGAAPDPHALFYVEPPARALRKRAPSEEGEEGWGGLVVGLPKWREDGVDTWEESDWRTFLRKRRKVVGGTEMVDRPIWEEEEDRVELETEADLADLLEDGVTEAKEDQEWQWDSYHPSIIPTNETFLHYILLLGITGRASEIARVFAWMRHLKIAPKRSTLGAALVLWREVCGRAVLVEQLTHRRKRRSPMPTTEKKEQPPTPEEQPPWMHGPLAEQARSEIDLAADEARQKALALVEAPTEYAKLVTWLHEWVPIYMMPGPRSLAMWTRNIERLRDGAQPVWEAEEAIECVMSPQWYSLLSL
ncbi:hypothetical protein C0991_005789 [Blastosporella zonata]|nr:hypothetical protein C0991_005789 [Blastosporella zonata]